MKFCSYLLCLFLFLPLNISLAQDLNAKCFNAQQKLKNWADAFSLSDNTKKWSDDIVQKLQTWADSQSAEKAQGTPNQIREQIIFLEEECDAPGIRVNNKLVTGFKNTVLPAFEQIVITPEPSTLYGEAVRLLDRDQVNEAIEQFTILFSQCYNDVDQSSDAKSWCYSSFWLAEAHFMQADDPAAYLPTENVADQAQALQLAEAAYMQGLLCTLDLEPQAGTEESAAEADSEAPPLPTWEADARAALTDEQKMIVSIFQRETGPDDLRTRLFLLRLRRAQRFSTAEEWKAAQAEWRKIFNYFGHPKNSQWVAASYARVSKNGNDAWLVACLEQIEQGDPTFDGQLNGPWPTDVYLQLARICLEMGDEECAADNFLAADTNKKYQLGYMAKLADVYAAGEDQQSALWLWEKILAWDPLHDVLAAKVTFQLAQGKTAESLAEAVQAAQEGRCFQAGSILLKVGQLSDSADVASARSVNAACQAADEEARQAINQGLALILMNHAKALEAQGEHSEALEVVKEIKTIDGVSGDSLAYVNLLLERAERARSEQAAAEAARRAQQQQAQLMQERANDPQYKLCQKYTERLKTWWGIEKVFTAETQTLREMHEVVKAENCFGMYRAEELKTDPDQGYYYTVKNTLEELCHQTDREFPPPTKATQETKENEDYLGPDDQGTELLKKLGVVVDADPFCDFTVSPVLTEMLKEICKEYAEKIEAEAKVLKEYEKTDTHQDLPKSKDEIQARKEELQALVPPPNINAACVGYFQNYKEGGENSIFIQNGFIRREIARINEVLK